MSRSELFKPIRRVVVKVGSGVLTAPTGLNLSVIEGLTSDMGELKQRGIQVILVSSGAIASGLRKMGMPRRPDSLSQKQALAAVGQASLIMAYEEAFERHGFKVAQILLTRDDLAHRVRYLNARNTLLNLLRWNVIPIINENDTVSVDEIKFGDNDNLSAMVTTLTEAQLLINLTNIDGLYDKDPREHQDARLLREVSKVDRTVTRYAGALPGLLGTGGMGSKIKAARKVALRGVPTLIANGLKPGILLALFEGQEEGTLFLPQKASICGRKHWIAFTKASKGEIVIDRGAERAIRDNGKSLLPSGIKLVRGTFSRGNTVRIRNEEGQDVGVGMVNYHAEDIQRIMGGKTSEIEARLGFKQDDEVIHRDNLVLAAQTMDDSDFSCLFDG